MNERIKELVEQATTIDEVWGRGFDLPEYTERFDKEKFAELIVRECCQIADEAERADVPVLSSKFIKAHFGVK